MSDQAIASGEGEQSNAPIEVVTLEGKEELTLNHAAKALADHRFKRNSPAESAEQATAEDESAQADAAPAEDHSEDAPEVEPAEQPSIEPPRSWTKEEKEEFKSYPREAQEKIAKAATRYESEFRRSQNEIAETRKAVEAEREQAKQERLQYEAKAKAYVQATNETGQFADIRNMQDLERLQTEDPFRFQAYQLHVWKTQAAQTELAELEQKRTQERQSNLVKYQNEETQKLSEFVPDVKDPEKLKDLTTKAIAHLKSFGPSDQDLNGYTSEGEKPFIFSAAFQRILLNSMKYEEVQSAKKAIADKPIPQVQRPGTAKLTGSDVSGRIQDREKTLNNTGALKDAVALLVAKRAAQRRAS